MTTNNVLFTDAILRAASEKFIAAALAHSHACGCLGNSSQDATSKKMDVAEAELQALIAKAKGDFIFKEK
jgi:hypothetical protein